MQKVFTHIHIQHIHAYIVIHNMYDVGINLTARARAYAGGVLVCPGMNGGRRLAAVGGGGGGGDNVVCKYITI